MAAVTLSIVAGRADAGVPPDPVAPSHAAQWYGLPVVFWTPETRLGFGILGGAQFEVEPGARPSYVQSSAVYTLESQTSAELLFESYSSRRFAVTGAIRASNFPDRFWGIGATTRDEDEEQYTSRYLELKLAPEVYLLPGRLRAGPRLYFRRELLRDVEAGSRMATQSLAGDSAYTAVGVGATVTWDTRDSSFWPLRGSFAQANYVFHPGALVDRGDFGRGAGDVRRYVTLWRAHVLAVGAHVEAVHGAVPITLLPKLGGGETLRGYYSGRWRDRAYWAAQSEYRFPIRGRFAGTVFAGAGGVAPRVTEFVRQPVRVGGGAGLRYRVTSAGVNIRADVAAGSQGMAMYLVTLEAL